MKTGGNVHLDVRMKLKQTLALWPAAHCSCRTASLRVRPRLEAREGVTDDLTYTTCGP